MKGKVTQILGPVVDVQFDQYSPKMYEAINIPTDKTNIVLEVGQLLAGGRGNR
jgi:F-type H+-transporting ATPase subunit beta